MENEFGKKYIPEETLEEAAEYYVKMQYPMGVEKEYIINDFISGAKWQEERMYSEEDLIKAFIAGGNSQIEEDDDYGTEYDAYMEEWFEQFKNKCQKHHIK